MAGRLGRPKRPASAHLLNRVCRDKRTFWEKPDASLADAASMKGVAAVVVAPILDRDGAVLGVLYGDRLEDNTRVGVSITEVEARLVELLASGVAAGLARLEQEKKALAAQVQFEQFFTPELARHWPAQPDLLKGRDTEVTVLFCDVRGFSRVSERLGPEATMNWMGDVLSELSGVCRQHKGVLVDYVGDELLAMWGAPGATARPRRAACRAALAMLALCAAPQRALAETIWASRRPSASASTRAGPGGQHRLDAQVQVRPAGQHRQPGQPGAGGHETSEMSPLHYQGDGGETGRFLSPPAVVPDPGGEHRRAGGTVRTGAGRPAGLVRGRDGVEQALAEFESRQFRESSLRLAALRARQPDDGPALVLLSRAVNCMVQESDPQAFDSVWVLPSK